jgi:hypothetical protein
MAWRYALAERVICKVVTKDFKVFGTFILFTGELWLQKVGA